MSSHFHWLIVPGVVAIALLSCALYATVYFKGFNSDHAIQVLMAEDFSLASDLYYWGQDRLGSILPMLAYPLVVLGIPAVWAISLAQYLLLGGAYFFLQGFFRSFWLRLLLALAIFLPHAYFQVQVTSGHPYVGQLFFIALFLFSFFKENWATSWRLLIAGLAAMLAIWCSEIAIAALGAFLLVYRQNILKLLKHPKNLVAAALGLVAGVIFILVAKNNSAGDGRYLQFLASWQEVITAINLLAGGFIDLLTFNALLPVFSLIGFMIILLAAWLFIGQTISRLAGFALLSSFFSFLLVLLSKWSAIMDYPIRYYTPAFFFLLLALLLQLTTLKKALAPHILATALMIAIAFSGYQYLRDFDHEVIDRVNPEEARQFAAMGNYGLVASYWNSYTVDALSDKIKATPFYGSYIRHWPVVEEVFQKDSIIIIRNGFLPELPDTITQFDRHLQRISEVKQLKEFEYAFYQKTSR